MTATKGKEKAAFICSRDTLDGAYPPLILGINAARKIVVVGVSGYGE